MQRKVRAFLRYFSRRSTDLSDVREKRFLLILRLRFRLGVTVSRRGHGCGNLTSLRGFGNGSLDASFYGTGVKHFAGLLTGMEMIILAAEPLSFLLRSSFCSALAVAVGSLFRYV